MTGWLPEVEAHAPGNGAPLAGVRVLDFSELLPGPFFTQSLVELGADVLKVERPPGGDAARRMAPALFDAVNRGKRCLRADLKNAEQAEQVRQLADQADVLVESYRPGVLERLGFGFEALRQSNPRLIHVSLTGYGATGPRAHWPGHDINYLAASGSLALASASGASVGGAAAFTLPVADLGGAVYALAAVNAALFQRERTGRGQRLDISLTDCMVHWMNPRLANFRHHGADSLEAQRRSASARPAYGVFSCRDGLALSVGALEDHFWHALVDTLGLDAWRDAAYHHHAGRGPHAEAINRSVAEALSQIDRAQAVTRLAAADVPVFEVLSPYELAHSEQLMARGLYADTARGALCRFPVRMEGVVPPPTHAEAQPEAG